MRTEKRELGKGNNIRNKEWVMKIEKWEMRYDICIIALSKSSSRLKVVPPLGKRFLSHNFDGEAPL